MKNLIFIGLILLLSCQGNQKVTEEKIIDQEQDELSVPNEEDSAFTEKHKNPMATNQIDGDGLQQGKWILWGKDFPEKGLPAEAKIEEGNYRDGKKIDQWLYYTTDGMTIKQKSNYADGALHGITLNYDLENKTVTEIDYDMDKILSISSRPIEE